MFIGRKLKLIYLMILLQAATIGKTLPKYNTILVSIGWVASYRATYFKAFPRHYNPGATMYIIMYICERMGDSNCKFLSSGVGSQPHTQSGLTHKIPFSPPKLDILPKYVSGATIFGHYYHSKRKQKSVALAEIWLL